jgi:hypothetical protein
MRMVLAGLLAGIMAGCVVVPERAPIDQATLKNIATNMPHCSEAHVCEAMWAAARDWVVSSCGMKIQTISDSFIETYNSDGYGTLLSHLERSTRGWWLRFQSSLQLFLDS